jgi:hypothetical protein
MTVEVHQTLHYDQGSKVLASAGWLDSTRGFAGAKLWSLACLCCDAAPCLRRVVNTRFCKLTLGLPGWFACATAHELQPGCSCELVLTREGDLLLPQQVPVLAYAEW